MDILRRWRAWIRPVCFTVYFICLMIALPLCILELNRKGAPDHVQAWFIGGLFVMMAVPISFWGILQHIIYYTQPELQRHIIRVLWMVPIYALNAWFALRFPPAAIYLDTLRECYEAYVIYNFMRFLINFLHQEHPSLVVMLENKPAVKHFFPFCLLPAWAPGRVFFNRCKHGVLQYTVVRPTMTAVALISQLAGKYDEGNFNFASAWSYIVIINNISQVWAMYCLVLFYKGTKEELAPIKPVPKFLCVKAVVFLSFWQSTIIAALAKLNVIPTNGTWVFYHSVEEVATGLQDFLICLEMFLAAIAHYYSFSHVPYADADVENQNCCATFMSMWDVRDMRDDVIEHARYIGHGVQKRFGKTRVAAGSASERTPLLNSHDSSIMDNPSASVAEDTEIPPVMTDDKTTTTRAYDARSLSDTDWERSSETFHVKSTTPSLVNFAEFSTSVEVNPLSSEHMVYTTQRLDATATSGTHGAAGRNEGPSGVRGGGDTEFSGMESIGTCSSGVGSVEDLASFAMRKDEDANVTDKDNLRSSGVGSSDHKHSSCEGDVGDPKFPLGAGLGDTSGGEVSAREEKVNRMLTGGTGVTEGRAEASLERSRESEILTDVGRGMERGSPGKTVEISADAVPEGGVEASSDRQPRVTGETGGPEHAQSEAHCEDDPNDEYLSQKGNTVIA